MASELKSYVEKYLLNPAASFNVDDEGNTETNAQILEGLAEDEGIADQQPARSKLRARNEALVLETDAKYKGKKVSRKDLKKEITYDPELSKYFAYDTSDEEGDDDEEEEEGEDEVDDEEEEGEDDDVEEEVDDDEVKADDDSEEESIEAEEEDMDDDGEEEEDDNEDEPMDEGNKDGFTYEGDFSKFAEDIEEESDDESDIEDDEEKEDDDHNEDKSVETKKSGGASIKTYQSLDDMEEIQKSICVKKQLAVYDSLFELRIGMQKGISFSNQLPQHDTYKKFLKEKDPNYMKNVASAKSTVKKLLSTLLEAQELLLKHYPETKDVITKNKESESESEDDDIESDNDKEKQNDDLKRGKKRKLKMEEYGEMLTKRHAAMMPFRDETFTRWYEKTKLLTNKRSHDKFSGFEVSALQQLNNVLNNKPQLIRRTQLTGATRGTAYHILGKNDETIPESEKEEYDPEIFDDNDFYSRALEEMLKSKMSLSDTMSDVSRRWIEIQKLRKKAKRRQVDTKASKGRKIRYDVIAKLQQYLAPCNPPQMDDSAINTLFASLFGQGVYMDKSVGVE